MAALSPQSGTTSSELCLGCFCGGGGVWYELLLNVATTPTYIHTYVCTSLSFSSPSPSPSSPLLPYPLLPLSSPSPFPLLPLSSLPLSSPSSRCSIYDPTLQLMQVNHGHTDVIRSIIHIPELNQVRPYNTPRKMAATTALTHRTLCHYFKLSM